MTITAFGMLLDRDGMALEREFFHDRHGALETRRSQWATPSAGLRTRQPADIRVYFGGSHVGRLEHLERDRDGKLWGVAMIKGFDPPEHDVFFSPALTFDERGLDTEITSVSIATRTAQLVTSPVRFLEGGIEWRGATRRWSGSELDLRFRPLLERACAAHVVRGTAPLLVHDEDERDVRTSAVHDWEPAPGTMQTSLAPPVPGRRGKRMVMAPDGSVVDLEIRPCGPILSVR